MGILTIAHLLISPEEGVKDPGVRMTRVRISPVSNELELNCIVAYRVVVAPTTLSVGDN